MFTKLCPSEIFSRRQSHEFLQQLPAAPIINATAGEEHLPSGWLLTLKLNFTIKKTTPDNVREWGLFRAGSPALGLFEPQRLCPRPTFARLPQPLGKCLSPPQTACPLPSCCQSRSTHVLYFISFMASTATWIYLFVRPFASCLSTPPSIKAPYRYIWLPRVLSGKESACQCRRHKR